MSDELRTDGFTLIELLLSTMIVGIVLGAVFGSLVLYFNTVTDTTDRLTESPSLQLVSSWFGTDAASAEAYTYPAAPCVQPSGTRLVNFSWTDQGETTGSLDNKVVSVAYAVENDTAPSHQKVLKRYACTEGPPVGGAKTTSVITVMHYLSPVAAESPTLLCGATSVSPATSCPSGTSTITIEFRMCTANTSAATCRQSSVLGRVQGHRRAA